MITMSIGQGQACWDGRGIGRVLSWLYDNEELANAYIRRNWFKHYITVLIVCTYFPAFDKSCRSWGNLSSCPSEVSVWSSMRYPNIGRKVDSKNCAWNSNFHCTTKPNAWCSVLGTSPKKKRTVLKKRKKRPEEPTDDPSKCHFPPGLVTAFWTMKAVKLSKESYARVLFQSIMLSCACLAVFLDVFCPVTERCHSCVPERKSSTSVSRGRTNS